MVAAQTREAHLVLSINADQEAQDRPDFFTTVSRGAQQTRPR